MKEVWRTIKSCPGYEVSNFGNIRTDKPRNALSSGGVYRYLKGTVEQKSGYVKFTPFLNGKNKTMLIHRAVLESFVGECPLGHEAVHNNGVKDDNRLENLRWDKKGNNKKRLSKTSGKCSKEQYQSAHYILRRYNEWRRGADIKMDSPKKIGEAIDIALSALNILMEQAK